MTRKTSLQKMRRDTVRGSRWPGDTPEDSDYNDSVSGDSESCDSDSGDWDSESAYDSSDRESILSGDVQVMAGECSSFPGEDAEDAPDDNAQDAHEEGEGDRTGQARQDLTLTDEQYSILQRKATKFRGADAEYRLEIIRESADDIERCWRQEVEFDREAVEAVVRRFLYNRSRREPKRPKFGRKWTYQDILVDMHRQELDEMAVEMSGSKAGSAAYLGCYQRAIKSIDQRLDEETRVKYRAEATKWTEQIPPPRQQQRMFEKHGISVIRDFSKAMCRQFGVRVAILGGYCDGDGEPTVMFYDNNNELGGTSFKSRYKDWPKDPMVEEFSRWTAESFGALPSDGSEEGRKKKDKTPNIKLPTDAQGYPVLPTWEAIDQEGLLYKKSLIGKFMSEMYHISAGGGKGRIPWARLQKARGDFILAEYLPKDVALTQYHHIRLEDANALLKHWTQRQAAGEIPFRFKKVDKAEQHGNRASGEDDASAMEAPRNQSEEGPQDANNDQARESHEENEGLANEGFDQNTTGPPRLLTSTSTIDPAAEVPTDPAPGSPAQEHAPDNQTAADERSPVPLQSADAVNGNSGTAADTRLTKRQKVSHRAGNVPPKTRRSVRAARPSERAKEMKTGSTSTRKGARR